MPATTAPDRAVMVHGTPVVLHGQKTLDRMTPGTRSTVIVPESGTLPTCWTSAYDGEYQDYNGQWYLLGLGTSVCDKNMRNGYMVIRVWHCQPLFWGCFWWPWGDMASCTYGPTVAGEEVGCPGTYRWGFYAVGTGSGCWNIEVIANFWDYNGNWAYGDVKAVDLCF
jgi:hypothetical protein